MVKMIAKTDRTNWNATKNTQLPAKAMNSHAKILINAFRKLGSVTMNM